MAFAAEGKLTVAVVRSGGLRLIGGGFGDPARFINNLPKLAMKELGAGLLPDISTK